MKTTKTQSPLSLKRAMAAAISLAHEYGERRRQHRLHWGYDEAGEKRAFDWSQW